MVSGAPCSGGNSRHPATEGSARARSPATEADPPVYGEPFTVPRSSWPRRKAAVAKWTEVVRERLADHVVAAQALTGLPLPGPPKIKSALSTV